jgi:hypothetical protein
VRAQTFFAPGNLVRTLGIGGVAKVMALRVWASLRPAA